MDEKKKPIGRGRAASLLDLMKQNEKAKRSRAGLSSHSLETPSVSSLDQTKSDEQSSSQLQSSISSNTSAGRGMQLTSLLKSMSSNEMEHKRTLGHGRGNLLELAKIHIQSTSSLDSSMSDQRQDYHAGVLGKLSNLSVYDDPPSSNVESFKDTAPICRQGKSGIKLDMLANYIDLKLEPGKGLFQYEVKYSPDIDSRGLRRKLLNQHSVDLGRTKTFDGTLLYLPIRLPQDKTCYDAEHPMDGSKVTLTIIYKKQQSMNENIHFFNILFGRIMRALSLVRIGRQNFNPKCAHAINQHRLEVWPGYVTAIDEYEGGLKLCLDVKHRVMRTQTIRDIITEFCQNNRCNYKDIIASEIIGTSVLTRYNNNTYRIDDIAWDKTPKFVFSRKGENISLLDYYKSHWNIEIQDKEQPLLIHRAIDRTPTGEKQEKIILLVPELSYASGLTDKIRNNFRIMKDLDAITKIEPQERWNSIRRFIEEVKNNEVAKEILSGWGLHIDNDIVRFSGRHLEPETIYFGRNKKYCSTDRPGDWNCAISRSHVLNTPNLCNWHIMFIRKDMNCVKSFLEMLQNISSAIGMFISQPQINILKDDRTETYLREIHSNITDNLELMVIVFPSNRTDRYSAVKKLCCVQKPIASQVIISKTISNNGKLKGITEKIALQINCKLGGALWAVTIPLKNCMICGIDVYHASPGSGSKRSVAGFISSLNNQLTKWHSRICIQGNRQELVDMLQICFVAAVNAYNKYNGRNPDRIIIYRDGVGDGDLDYVAKYEIKQFIETFNRINPDYKPQLSVIVVQKRINTRLFVKSSNGLVNPLPGTIVDSCITRRNYYDFFLVPQNVRHGTVTPTHYIVIHDSSKLETDHMQRLTYKLCHLYYNWPGTIRVPAPCQYAHKLVYLVGQNIQTNPHDCFSDTLFYL